MPTDTAGDRQCRTPGWPDKHMLEAAMGLLANARAFDDNTGWDQARREWMDAYHRQQQSAGVRGTARAVLERWVTAGGPVAAAAIVGGVFDSARAVLSAVVPGKTPERPRG